jgi:RimJ/RimL family protein N-acetyltransferase
MPLLIQHRQLSVRHIIEADKAGFIDLVQHPMCMKYSMTGVLSEQQAIACFDKLLSNKKHKMYVIEAVNQGEIIGCTGLQDCYVDDEIEPSFILRLLPDFHDHEDLLPLVSLLIEQLRSVYQLPLLQVVVAKNNQFIIQLISELKFTKVKSITCRGIQSHLYQLK